MADFRKLEVWQKAHALAIEVVRSSEPLGGRTATIVRDQLVRAALSIPSNIAEGSAKKSDREFARYIRIALGSSTEVENHLLVAGAIGLMDATTCARFEGSLRIR